MRKQRRHTPSRATDNVGGLPETLHLKLLKPLRELIKDEVPGLKRVVYDISGKLPAMIEQE